jgi:GT2 family glycosyltransferase
VDALLKTLDSDATYGMVAPRLEYPDGRRQLSADCFPTVQHKLRRFAFLKQMERRLPASPDTGIRAVDYAISAFWLMKREVLTTVGLLDERIFYSPEDVDYCIRVWKAGFQIMYDPSVRVVHDAREISRGLIPSKATFSHAAGLAYLFRKHGYVLTPRALYREIEQAVERRRGRVYSAGVASSAVPNVAGGRPC